MRVLVHLECARQTADPGFHVPPERGGHWSVSHHVGDREPPSRLEHPEGITQHVRLVGSQVDHAITDDDIDRVCGQRDLLDAALEERDIGCAGLGLVFLGQG